MIAKYTSTPRNTYLVKNSPTACNPTSLYNSKHENYSQSVFDMCTCLTLFCSSCPDTDNDVFLKHFRIWREKDKRTLVSQTYCICIQLYLARALCGQQGGALSGQGGGRRAGEPESSVAQILRQAEDQDHQDEDEDYQVYVQQPS